MSDIIRRIQKKFRRVRHSKTKIMNGKGNARKLITPNKKPKGPTPWDRLLAAAPRAKGHNQHTARGAYPNPISLA